MPEIIEVELYRRLADERALERAIAGVDAHDEWFLKGDTTAELLSSTLVGSTIDATRRIGKLMLLDVGDAVVGLRYGMSGRLLVDDAAAIARLEYSSDRDDPAWDRFALRFGDGGRLVLRDPRRLGGVELDPDESRLGVDAWTITADELGERLAGSRTSLKARLMDQGRIAGLGNLLTDEILWRSGVAPVRAAGSLDDGEVELLAATVRATVGELAERGGSHTGDLHDERNRGGHCPADGTPLRRETVGGRTTYWCPEHQR
ncbi:MAG: DNA-formamidopyrimidine glycosylase family protein [Actinomycetota bacterium]